MQLSPQSSPIPLVFAT